MTTTNLVNIHYHIVKILFLVKKTLKIYSLSNLQIYSIVNYTQCVVYYIFEVSFLIYYFLSRIFFIF